MAAVSRAAAGLALLAGIAGTAARADVTIANFAPGFDLAWVEARDVTLALVPPAGTPVGALKIAAGHHEHWPGITLKPRTGAWDLSRYATVALDVHSLSASPFDLGLRVDNPGGDGSRHCLQQVFTIQPGERRTISVALTRPAPAGFDLFGMNGYPGQWAGGDHSVDPRNVIQILVFLSYPDRDHQVEIADLRALGDAPPPPDPATFFPFIDEFGQYVHKDWPGKLHAATDFAERLRAESADLDAHLRPSDRDPWGGWANGPKLAAKGHFYPVKLKGAWWLVDPDGRLFWSQGIDCVGLGVAGPIEARDRWYRGIPADDPTFKGCFWTGDARSDDRYKDKKIRYFDWGAANLIRKYGTAWQDSAADRAHRRLASWGMNTIGNWSEASIYLKRRTPYTVDVWFQGKDLAGSEGYWGKFRDVFDASFRADLRKSLAEQQGKTADDPWCLGYFIDNEMNWGNTTDLAAWTLECPGTQKAKQVFVADLKKRYADIAKLNAAWGTAHGSWDELLQSRTSPGRERAKADLEAFVTRTAETYFRTVREEVKRVAPHTLYLGCRFAWVNDLAVKAAAGSCDVITYNLYERTVGSFALPAGVDRPVLIGEFHCGALDRGLFHPGLQSAANQDERAAFYRAYVESAVRNPVFVGAHWFQYLDEPTTGRFDGENYQIGFVDVADTPYPETVAACRATGEELYRLRRP